METINNELERAQLGAASAAGCGAPLDYLPSLKNYINLAREIASQYCLVSIENSRIRAFVARFFMRQLKDAVKILPGYIEDLKRGKCMEAFSISSGLRREDLFWLWCERICSDMEGESFCESLKCYIEDLKTLLAEAEKALMHCDSAMFERFYFAKKQNYSGDAISKRFEKWRYENLCVTIDKLRELQAKVVAESLTKGIMNFAPVPSQKELNEVRLDYLRGFLPYDFVTSDDFCVACAQWRQFIHWNDTILIIDYKKYGKYIQNHYYDFSDTQLQAIFELDMKLYLIHKEMARLNPELINMLQPTETGQLEDTILFAPYNTITRMLQQDWFDAVSVDKEKYTTMWRDELVSSLMKSEIGHVIAEEWQIASKRPQQKAAVVYGLKRAGVIQGSDLGIASAIVGDNNTDSKTFANYMGRGKKGNIADWICNHVKD
jgi:hypothetical protein